MSKVLGFEQRLQKETFRANTLAFVLDVFLYLYLAGGAYYLVDLLGGADFAKTTFMVLGGGFSLFRTLLYLFPSLDRAGLSKRLLGWFLSCRLNTFMKNQKDMLPEWNFKSWASLQLNLALWFTFVLGFVIIKVDLYALFSWEGFGGVQRIFASFLSPNWFIMDRVLSAMVETIFISFVATALALPPSFLLSFFCARNLAFDSHSYWPRLLYTVFRFIANFSRSVEPLIWAIIFSVWVGIGPFAGMLALCLHSLAALIKLYSEQVEGVNQGPIEAMKATGAHPVQVIWYAVVPQIVLPYLSFTIYRWDINIRMATVIGLVGGGGIGTLLAQYQGMARWHEVGTIIIVIAAVVWAMDYLSARVREAIY